MSSDKDDDKGIGPEESTADEKTDSSVDDPSLEEDSTPVATDEELAEAGRVLAESGADGDSESTKADDAVTAESTDADHDAIGDDAIADDVTGDEATGDADEPEEPGQMSLLDHLGELRVRLTRAFIAIGVGMVACYGFADKMFDVLMHPMVQVFQKQMEAKPFLTPEFYTALQQTLTDTMAAKGFQQPEQITLFVDALQKTLMQVAQEGHFQYTYPAEAFFSYIKISIVAGLFLVSPYVFAQIWGFIAPGLYSHERKWMVPMAVISAMFFTAGATFGYFIVFPYGFEFFASFATEGIQFTPKLNEYLDFCLKLLFAFGFIFELPLFIFFLARMGMVSSAGLRSKRKYAILVAFVVAAILTPPDPFTQCLMAGPLIILYEIGIWVSFFFGKKEKRHLAQQAEAEAKVQAEMDAAAKEAEETVDSESDTTTEKV